MARVKAPVAEDMREFAVRGKTIKVMTRPADGGRLARFFEPAPNTAIPVEPVAFSLPGTPDGLVIQMNERGDGYMYAVGEARVSLGSDGMWWIVTRLVEALEDPQTVSTQPRFLTLSGFLGGPATQASLQYSETGVCVVWRRLESGVVGDVLAWQELTHERAQGWLSMLRPILCELELRQVHQLRLLPANTAQRWANVLERRIA